MVQVCRSEILKYETRELVFRRGCSECPTFPAPSLDISQRSFYAANLRQMLATKRNRQQRCWTRAVRNVLRTIMLTTDNRRLCWQQRLSNISGARFRQILLTSANACRQLIANCVVNPPRNFAGQPSRNAVNFVHRSSLVVMMVHIWRAITHVFENANQTKYL